MARYDLLNPVCRLASLITKWDALCDKRLHRLVCYINSSLDVKMVGWVGDPTGSLYPMLFADADFAGCPYTARSTTGGYLSLWGKDTRFPIAAVCRRQQCTSHSTPEAEIVAADTALRTIGIPALELWSIVLNDEKLILQFQEDNSTMITVMKTGKNPTMRHLNRTHRVSIHWLH